MAWVSGENASLILSSAALWLATLLCTGTFPHRLPFLSLLQSTAGLHSHAKLRTMIISCISAKAMYSATALSHYSSSSILLQSIMVYTPC